MYVLWLFISAFVGGAEHVAQMESYSTIEECQTELTRIAAEMDLAYPKPEEKTFRFECRPRHSPPGRLGI
jgi:hypothetical protein